MTEHRDLPDRARHEPVARSGWTLPGPDFYGEPERAPWGPALGLVALAAVVLGVTIAISAVTDGRPEWLLTAFGIVSVSLAGAGAREVFHVLVPAPRRRAAILGVVRPALLIVFFGSAGTFFFYVFMLDPSCTDCGTPGSDAGGWALLVGCWACGLVFAVSAWRNHRGQGQD